MPDYEVKLPEVTVTPRNNLNLGQAVRNGTSRFAKPIGEGIVAIASLHPDLWIADAIRDVIGKKVPFSIIPFINNLVKTRKIVEPLVRVVSKPEPGVTRVALTDYNKELGHIDLSDSYEKTNGIATVYPEYIKVNEKGKGLSKALYAAGIEETKKPILSGEVLLQPEKTTKTYKYFEGPELPPLIPDEGYNYPRKIMLRPKNKRLYEDTIEDYQNGTARYSNNLAELWKLISH